jgi:hypothetical protein
VLTLHLFWTLQKGVAKYQDHVVFVACSKGVGRECGEKSLQSGFASGGSEGDCISYIHYQWEGYFSSKLPQNSPCSKQGGFCKLGVFFSTSNCKIL